MSKYEGIYNNAVKQRGHASWIETAVYSLAVDLGEYTGLPTRVAGPFGLRASVDVRVDESRFVRLTPEFPDEGLRLYYDTGERTDTFQPGTLGDMNGFNNVVAPLPDTLAGIVGVLRDY